MKTFEDVIGDVNLRGVLCILGSFIIQLTLGAYHGTFGNMVPYFSSYMKRRGLVSSHGDIGSIYAIGGFVQGFFFLLAGIVLVPVIGNRKCLILGCFLCTLAPLLTYITLDHSLPLVCLSYSVLSSMGFPLVMIPSNLIPVTWFTNKGAVTGIVGLGFGLSALLFSPFQTYLINPRNIPPVTEDNGTLSYFVNEAVLENIPVSQLYTGAIYSVLFILGILLTSEKERDCNLAGKLTFKQSMKNSFNFLKDSTLTKQDFYLLYFTKLCMMTMVLGISSQWKVFLSRDYHDDQTISVIGGINGLMSGMSRLVAGVLLDKIRYSKLMAGSSLLLIICCSSVYFVYDISFTGAVVILWFSIFLCCSHFTSVTVQALLLFKNNSTALGTISSADSLSFATLGLITRLVFADPTDTYAFLWFFIALASTASLSLLNSFFGKNEKLIPFSTNVLATNLKLAVNIPMNI